jgi:hypothetical protein
MRQVLSVRKRPYRQVHLERKHDVLRLRIRFCNRTLRRRRKRPTSCPLRGCNVGAGTDGARADLNCQRER